MFHFIGYNFRQLFALVTTGTLLNSRLYLYYECFALCRTLVILHLPMHANLNVTQKVFKKTSVQSAVCSSVPQTCKRFELGATEQASDYVIVVGSMQGREKYSRFQRQFSSSPTGRHLL